MDMRQARDLINNIEIKVIKNGIEREVGAFEIVKTGDTKSYKSIDVLTVNDIEYIKNEVLKTLTQTQQKLEMYNDFKKTSKLIAKSIEALNSVQA